MRDIADIPNIPNQQERLEAILVDCYGQYEELAAFGVYFDDAMRFPFAATWRDPDEPGHQEQVTVLGAEEYDDRRGILLQVNVQRTGRQRRVVAEQIWADDEKSANAIVLDDYRHWVDHMGGLDVGYE